MTEPGFLFVLIGLPLAAVGTILIARALDYWIDRAYNRLQASRRTEFYSDPLIMPWEADEN